MFYRPLSSTHSIISVYHITVRTALQVQNKKQVCIIKKSVQNKIHGRHYFNERANCLHTKDTQCFIHEVS